MSAGDHYDRTFVDKFIKARHRFLDLISTLLKYKRKYVDVLIISRLKNNIMKNDLIERQ